jgi:glucose-1-phosphate cytidylyltransferase
VQPSGRFGELEFKGDRVTDFAEKPSQARGWINGGFFVLNRQVFDLLYDDPDLVFEGPPITQLVQDGELMAYRHEGFWHPMDNSRDFRYLNSLWNERKAPWKVWDQAPSRHETPYGESLTARRSA